MPPRKRHLGRAHRGWSEEQIQQLRLGHCFFGDDGFGDCYEQRRSDRPFDAELAHQAWRELGERLTAEHIAEEPGTRPWGWWRWEATEGRRVVAGKPSDHDGYLDVWPDQREPAWYFFGKPNATHAPGNVCYETQRDYLERLHLLTEDERAALVALELNTENDTCPQ